MESVIAQLTEVFLAVLLYAASGGFARRRLVVEVA